MGLYRIEGTDAYAGCDADGSIIFWGSRPDASSGAALNWSASRNHDFSTCLDALRLFIEKTPAASRGSQSIELARGSSRPIYLTSEQLKSVHEFGYSPEETRLSVRNDSFTLALLVEQGMQPLYLQNVGQARFGFSAQVLPTPSLTKLIASTTARKNNTTIAPALRRIWKHTYNPPVAIINGDGRVHPKTM